MNLLDAKNAIAQLLNSAPTPAQAPAYANVYYGLQDLLQQFQIDRQTFTYTVPVIASIAAAGVSTQLTNIQADADFLMLAGCFFTDTGAQTISTVVVPNCTVLITDSATGNQLMDSDVALGSLFGTGSLPFVWPQPYLFKARGSITTKVTNVSAATTYTNLRLAYIGCKLKRVA